MTFQITIDVVRHGETDANRNQIVQGHMNDPLNETGRKQAGLLAAWLQSNNVSYSDCISSDLDRPKQTRDIILDVAGLKTDHFVDHGVTESLRERCYGEMEGKTFKEQDRAAEAAGCLTWYDYVPVGSETHEQVYARAVTAFRDVVNKMQVRHKTCEQKPAKPNVHAHPHLLLVAHGGLNRTLVKYFVQECDMKVPADKESFPHQANTAISRYVVSTRKEGGYDIECKMMFHDEHLQNK